MVKKLKAMADKKSASGARLFDSALAGSVKDSAQQIWLAGMGAFAKAQAEGGKVFDALVKKMASGNVAPVLGEISDDDIDNLFND